MAQKASKMNKKDQDLLKDITVMMTDPNQATNEKKITEIMKKIRNLTPISTPDQLRLASCHFMTMYHTRKAMSMGMPQDGGMDPQQAALMQQQAMLGGSGASSHNDNAINIKAVEKFKQEQRKDMELGWQLLNINGEDEQANKTARVLKIEVAQRLENSILLSQAFEDLISSKLSQEETMVAFTAAPFLGDWKEMMKLGKKIESMQGGGLEQLHMMSLQLPIPDFSLIYELAKEYNLGQTPKPDVETLTWELFNVSKIRVKFNNVDCGEYEEKRQELMDEITKQGEIEWEDVPNVSHVHIKRMGALCQAVSFGEVPMMLNGPWFDSKIHVKGRAEMPLMNEQEQEQAQLNPYNMQQNMENMTILIQEEEWKLEKDINDSNIYRGEYYLKQRPDLPANKQPTAEHAPVNMTFNIEIYINQQNINHESLDYKSDINNEEEDEMNEEKNENDNDDDNNVEDVTSKHNHLHDHKLKEEIKNEESEKITTEFDGLELD